MGTRELAYEIEKNKRGYYYLAYFTAPTEAVLELERNYNTNESIIRHIFIKFESKKEVAHWTSMSAEAAKKAK
jgi:small subunit ribosomal protein S6